MSLDGFYLVRIKSHPFAECQEACLGLTLDVFIIDDGPAQWVFCIFIFDFYFHGCRADFKFDRLGYERPDRAIRPAYLDGIRVGGMLSVRVVGLRDGEKTCDSSIFVNSSQIRRFRLFAGVIEQLGLIFRKFRSPLFNQLAVSRFTEMEKVGKIRLIGTGNKLNAVHVLQRGQCVFNRRIAGITGVGIIDDVIVPVALSRNAGGQGVSKRHQNQQHNHCYQKDDAAGLRRVQSSRANRRFVFCGRQIILTTKKVTIQMAAPVLFYLRKNGIGLDGAGSSTSAG